MPVTLKDIAKVSGFSVTQVSRALGGYHDVSETTRSHIIKIANDLGYEPNSIARQLQSQRTHTIGIIVPMPVGKDYDDFFSILFKAVTNQSAQQGYDVLVSAASSSGSELDTYRRIVGGKRVDGVIVARTYRNDERINYLQEQNYPFIVHGRLAPDEQSDFSYIDVDSQYGIHLLTTHLIHQGYTNIGIILPPENFAFAPYRLSGYRDALHQHQLPFREAYCIYADLSYDGGKQAARSLLGRNDDLTAIIGCNDLMALGALEIAKEYGYLVGETFAIAGYDDIPAAAQSEPSLTTIRQPIYNIGEELTSNLIAVIENGKNSTDTFQRLVDPELIVRDSSKRFNK